MKTRQFVDPAAVRLVRLLAGFVLLVLMLVCAAFGSGAYWAHLTANGTTCYARMHLPGASEVDAKQFSFRLYEDAAATVNLLQAEAKLPGWRGEQAREYLGHLKDLIR